MADWLLYEHDDGRHAVAPSAEAATFAHADPAWHRVGPAEVLGLNRAADIVQALRVVLEAIRAADVSGVAPAEGSQQP